MISLNLLRYFADVSTVTAFLIVLVRLLWAGNMLEPVAWGISHVTATWGFYLACHLTVRWR